MVPGRSVYRTRLVRARRRAAVAAATAAALLGLGLGGDYRHAVPALGASADPASSVDPLIGTNGGNVYPGAVVPFGMLSWSPENTTATRPARPRPAATSTTPPASAASASPTCPARAARAAAATSRSSRTPVRSPRRPASDTKDAVYASDFSHADETAEPGHYKVGLDSGVDRRPHRDGPHRLRPLHLPGRQARLAADPHLELRGGSADSSVTIDPADQHGHRLGHLRQLLRLPRPRGPTRLLHPLLHRAPSTAPSRPPAPGRTTR